MFCCGDTTHFDLSWWAFNEIGAVEQGFMDVMYERLPSCPLASTLSVNRDTCDSYYGVISDKVTAVPVRMPWVVPCSYSIMIAPNCSAPPSFHPFLDD